jgi:DNA-binding transcriptional LysR family regulator
MEVVGMSDLLEFRLLKYIAMIAETGNFTRAAEKLYLAQPSLSEQIINLEEGLGIEIFDRSGKRVEPTPAGLVLVSYAKGAVRERNEIVKAARAIHHGEVPPLRLGFSSFVPTVVLEEFQRLYESVFPACPVHLAGGNAAQIVERLRNKTLDCALLPMPVEGDDIAALQIGSTPLVVCMRTDDPLAQLTEIRPVEMADRLTVFRDPESHPSAHKRLLEMLAECGVRPQVSCAAATPADVQWMVQKGFGLALIDGQTKLEQSLTTRAVAGVTWTADTAFVHHSAVDHLALPLLARHLRKGSNPKPRRPEQRKKNPSAVQLELLT